MQQKQRGRKSSAALAIVSNIKPLADPPRAAYEPPAPPQDLGAPEKAIWKQIFEDYSWSKRLSTNVLHNGLQSHQLAREAQSQIRKDGMLIDGVSGQSKAHPLLSVVRDHRAAWLATIKALGLEI